MKNSKPIKRDEGIRLVKWCSLIMLFLGLFLLVTAEELLELFLGVIIFAGTVLFYSYINWDKVEKNVAVIEASKMRKRL